MKHGAAEKDRLNFLCPDTIFRRAFFIYKPLYNCYKRFVDRYERNLIRNIICPGMVAIDVGANIGTYVKFMGPLVGSAGKIYAFEPSPQNFYYMKKSKYPDNTTLVQAALGNKTGQIELYMSDNLNVDHRTYDTGGNRKKLSVKCYRLDDYLDNKKVDFIKMDIQGYEYQALCGMENTLKENPDIKLLIEFWPFGLFEAGGSPEKLIRFLANRGFKTELLEGKNRKPCPPIPDGRGFWYYCTLFAYR